MKKVLKLISDFFKKCFEYGFGIALCDLLSRSFHFKIFYFCKHKLIYRWIDGHLGLNGVYNKTISGRGNKVSEDCPIFIYWKQGFENAPPIVQSCYKSVLKNACQHPVILLSDANIDQYIKVPAIVSEKLQKGKITIQTYSDIVRVLLLSSFGGIYLDSTIYMVNPFPFEMYQYELYSSKMSPIEANAMYVSESRWSVFFLACGKDSVFMDKVRYLFIEYLNKYCKYGQIDYFFLDYLIWYLYSIDKHCKKIIDSIPFNNKEIFYLQKECDSKYIPNDFETICKDTWLFKLNYRKFQNMDSIEPNSYGDILLKNAL